MGIYRVVDLLKQGIGECVSRFVEKKNTAYRTFVCVHKHKYIQSCGYQWGQKDGCKCNASQYLSKHNMHKLMSGANMIEVVLVHEKVVQTGWSPSLVSVCLPALFLHTNPASISCVMITGMNNEQTGVLALATEPEFVIYCEPVGND